ncbi:MAG TPA: peptidylprolyl isomerase [Gammaproteobacteria bacterium]
MKLHTPLRAGTATLLLGLLLCGPATAADTIDTIAAVVNDGVITSSELNRRLRLVRDQLQQQKSTPPPAPVLERQVLERMIVEELQMQSAAQSGISVDDIELNNSLRDIARRNNMNLLQFREVLERDGYDYNRFREDIRKEMLMTRLRERQVNSKISVSDQEVEHFLQREASFGERNVEYRLGHILVSVPEGASPEQIGRAREKVERLLRQLREGADFSALAIAESDGQQALQGGDLGWRDSGQIPRLFGDSARALALGAVSEPIRSPSGYHLVKLLDKRGEQAAMVTQTRVRHILVRTTSLVSDNEARLRLERLRLRIANGEEFEALARANSDDPLSATKGGELDWVSPGELVPPFEQAMNALAPGELSEPVKSQFGWHLIQVLERRERDMSEELKRNQARLALFKRKVEEETQLWLRRLRDEAYVDLRLGES